MIVARIDYSQILHVGDAFDKTIIIRLLLAFPCSWFTLWLWNEVNNKKEFEWCIGDLTGWW